MSALTKQEGHILSFVKNYLRDEGHSPTFQEIAAAVDLKSLATVHKHLHNLERKNFIHFATSHRSRSIELVPDTFRDWRFCETGHQTIWYRGDRCPLCKVIVELEGNHA